MVMSHYSFNSSSDISAIFGQMFPDSEIAKKFSCGATKAAYLICFGLGSYFKEQLINDIRKAPCYVVSFDECLNKVTQTEQLDVVVRHWSEREGKVVVHYFDSDFWDTLKQRNFWKGSREPCHHLIPISCYRFQWMTLLSTGSS